MLALARGLHMAGSFALAGTVLLCALFALGREKNLRGLAAGSLALALAAGLAWFLLEAANMAAATDWRGVSSALPIVAEYTRFGHVTLARLALLIAAWGGWRAGFPRLAVLPAFAAVIAEAWLGHGGAMEGAIGAALLGSAMLHLAAGAAWIGSLPALWLMLARLPRDQAAALAKGYSPLGIFCVLAMLASAGVQYSLLIGKPVYLITTAYGAASLAKMLLLAGLIGLAALNRRRLAPALARPGRERNILGSVGLEILLGFAALLAAAWLLNFAPPEMAMPGAQ